MKISIITVVLDNKKFIADAIESVLKQNYQDIEYIVIDGGSTDGSLEIINAYEHKISKIISEKDKGVYFAMNKGIALATGDIIGFLNADDFYANHDIIEKVITAFQNGNTDAIYGDLDYVSRSNKEQIIRKWVSGNYHDHKFYDGWMPPHPTFFVKSGIFKKFGGYNTLMRSSADYELMLRLIVNHHISLHYINEVLVKMRVGGQSNRSFKNRVKANMEDRKAWKINGLVPKFYTLWLKPIQKIFQYRF
ncbi:MAG: glycosyltransferase family 2 protein [Bacteroidota bacterium]